MGFCEYDAFLSELTRMFQKAKTTGSICITMKRYDGKTKPDPRPSKAPSRPPAPPSEYQCLIRVKLGRRKISTVVHAKDVNKFQMAYSNVLKGNIGSLKKRDKKSKSSSAKTKATQ